MPPASPTLIEVDRDLVESLRLAVGRLARRLRQQNEGEITASQFFVLNTIAHYGPITLGKLASVERLRPPSVTRMVAFLEESGLVLRRADTDDRRISRVEVTDLGRDLLARSHRGARAAPGGGALVTLVQLATQRTFRSLRIRNYRLFFFGQLVSVSGTWMQQLAQDWLVLRLTNRSLPVGITTALQFAPV